MYHSQNVERRLAMTFQMSQALAILQMNNLDLQQFLQEEIDKNPLLEEVKKESYFCDEEVPSELSIADHLNTQIRETFSHAEDRKIAETIAESLDEKGFLSALPSDIDTTRFESVLERLQTFDPPGIFARTLQESLLIQLKAKGLTHCTAYRLIESDYQNLLLHRYSLLKKKYPDLSEAIQKIATLQLRPLESLKKEYSCPIIPDLFIQPLESGWLIGFYDEMIPQFRVQYEDLFLESKEEQKTVDVWRSSGKWLLKALHRRSEIILQIAKRITHHQHRYLLQKGNLSHFTIQNLSQELGLHESTISRALSEKYVETPRGIILLKSLLTAAPEKTQAKEILQALVANERSPLSDDQLAKALEEKGFKVARRTVSKYRKELKIPEMNARKLFSSLIIKCLEP
ncbi:MAG TPA: hypothetical protein VLE96_05460 [Chlamydiales bacterium]|nr:hypothetical protein [Chlamydiales bacterium]